MTPFWGAYHKHFQVKPAIKVQGGLKVGMDKGVHDSDYYLEVSATSKAELTTILSKKVDLRIWFNKYPVFNLIQV